MLNVLSLWPEPLWRTKQSPSRRFYIRALAEREDVRLHQSGPGFADWNDSITAMQNISRIMPDCHAVVSYKALGGCEHGGVRNADEVARHLVTVEQFNECWAGTTTQYGGVMHPGGGTASQECLKAHIRLAVIHHENDRPRMLAAASGGTKIVHIPHAAHPMFAAAARPLSERSGVVLTGASNAEHYPLRQRWADLIRRGRIPGTHYRRPSNYSSSIEQSDALVKDYANALGRCRVKLGCASVWKYPLQHYSEAAMAGCAHVADMPDAVPDDFREMVVSVDPKADDATLVRAVESAMERSEEIGKAAHAVAKASYTTDGYAERLVNEIRSIVA